MVRLDGLSEGLRALFRPWAVEPAGIVTAFGGVTVLLFLLSLCYWVDDRRKVATVVSYAFVAYSVVLITKSTIGFGRPPATIQTVPLSADPYGFPSGHATAAVVVYGGLLLVYDRVEWPAVAGVGGLVVAVGLSRVVIGVHYLGDVLAGFALGVALLVVLGRTVGTNPRYGFATAACLAGVAVVLATPESLLGLGGSLGGLVGSTQLDRVPEPRSIAERGLLVVVGIPVVFGVEAAVETVSLDAVVVVGNALLVVTVLLLPALVGQLPLGRGSETR